MNTVQAVPDRPANKLLWAVVVGHRGDCVWGACVAPWRVD